MTRHLIELGADVKAKSITGLTAMHMSTIYGDVEIMRLLMGKGAKVNTSTDQGFTPLHTAASYGRTEAIKFLIENGADINAVNEDGAQPLTQRRLIPRLLYLIPAGRVITKTMMVHSFTRVVGREYG
jgi:ankyrin repeat protein